MAVNTFTNLPALNALRHLENASQALGDSSARLASGNRIQRPGDDPSGLARSTHMEVAIRDQSLFEKNALDARSLLQVTENGLNEVNNQLMRLRELSIAGASDISGPEERNALQIEAESIRDEIERIAQSTYYGKNFLLNGTAPDLSFQVGYGKDELDHIRYPSSTINVQAGELGVDSIDLSDADASRAMIETIDQALTKIQGVRAQTGAYQSRLNSVVGLAQQQKEVLGADLSRIRDTDYAKESTEFTKRKIQQQAAVAILAQANMLPENALRLLSPVHGY